MYIHQLKNWPLFVWDTDSLLTKLAEVHKHLGHILGMMEMLGFSIQENTFLDTLTADVVHSSEIEGERLNVAEVRLLIALRDIQALIELGILTKVEGGGRSTAYLLKVRL